MWLQIPTPNLEIESLRDRVMSFKYSGVVCVAFCNINAGFYTLTGLKKYTAYFHESN